LPGGGVHDPHATGIKENCKWKHKHVDTGAEKGPGDMKNLRLSSERIGNTR